LDTFTSNDGVIQFAKEYCAVSNVDGFWVGLRVVICFIQTQRKQIMRADNKTDNISRM